MIDAGGIAGDQLRQLVERIERLEEERKALSADIREVYAESRAIGFEPKVMRQIVKLRAMDTGEAREHEILLDTYKHALGME